MLADLDTHPDVSHLTGNRLFAGLSADVITSIGCDVNLIRFENDEVIFKEGEPGDCLYLVVEGCVRISKTGRGGKQETLGFIQPGNFFGEMALIDGQPRFRVLRIRSSARNPTRGHEDPRSSPGCGNHPANT